MYSNKGRYALAGLAVLCTLICVYIAQYQLASVAFFLFAFIWWSHIKHSSVLLASKYFKKAEYERADRILDEVENPERLAKNRRGYYEFMKANIALQREDYDVAEFHFQLASRYPLGGKNDTAFVLIHLANLALRKKDKNRALTYAEKAKNLANTSRATEIIKIIEKEANAIADINDEQ
jgi:hypothetical protein